MKKNVGKMYRGTINKKINSIQNVYYSKNKQEFKEEIEIKTEKSSTEYEDMSVEQKIDYLLNLPKYLPDFIVEITTKTDRIYTELDRKEGDELVTKSEARYQIKDIVNIDIDS